MSGGGSGVVVVEWIDAAGERRMQPPARIRREPVESGLPVRGFAHYKGSYAKPGWYYMATLNRHVPYESKLEAWVLLEIDFAGECEAILHQPCRLHFGTAEAPYRHIPDFLVRTRDGLRTLVDVKGSTAASEPRTAATFQMTRDICDAAGWGFRLAHEPDPTYFQNVRFLGSTRSPLAASTLDRYAHQVAEFVAAHDALPWGTVADALAQVVEPSVLPRAIARALWTRLLWTDLASPFSDETVLTAPEAAIRLGAAS